MWWITLYVLLSLIRWIAIYLLDNVIRPLYNWALNINQTGSYIADVYFMFVCRLLILILQLFFMQLIIHLLIYSRTLIVFSGRNYYHLSVELNNLRSEVSFPS